jgi:hypothetical protein
MDDGPCLEPGKNAGMTMRGRAPTHSRSKSRFARGRDRRLARQGVGSATRVQRGQMATFTHRTARPADARGRPSAW